MYLPEEDSGQEDGTEEGSEELTEDTEIGENSKETESSQRSGKTA